MDQGARLGVEQGMCAQPPGRRDDWRVVEPDDHQRGSRGRGHGRPAGADLGETGAGEGSSDGDDLGRYMAEMEKLVRKGASTYGETIRKTRIRLQPDERWREKRGLFLHCCKQKYTHKYKFES
jgi:hypothetical protein